MEVMEDKKIFLTYNQQMRKLRDDKGIGCYGSPHKRLLVRCGYFNIINGYKTPFICGKDDTGSHIYYPETTLDQIYSVKHFDDELRSFLLKNITQVEEEIRSLTSYKFDQCNDNGRIPWFDVKAYDPNRQLQYRMSTVAKAYNEVSNSKSEYIQFYKDNHNNIPTWIMLKSVNFSTFIDILGNSKKDVRHSICELYGLYDKSGLPSMKLLRGSLQWMRIVRNSCAHNERIYCITRSLDKRKKSGRIIEQYLSTLRPAYSRCKEQKLFDLLVYFKYYLPEDEFLRFINEFKSMLVNLKAAINEDAFDHVRAQMGIYDLEDLSILAALPKKEIEFNKFDKL